MYLYRIFAGEIMLEDLPLNPAWEDRLEIGQTTSESILGTWEQREAFQRWYTWGVPNDLALREIFLHIPCDTPIIEIGAGNGYWARLLNQMGYNITAYDAEPYVNHYLDRSLEFYPVQIGSYEQVEKHANDTLFLCWTPYKSELAYEAVIRHQGKYLIHIGEGQGGCTDNGAFFEYVEENYTELVYFSLESWYGLHDGLTIYERNENSLLKAFN